jgi:hypothetical protein
LEDSPNGQVTATGLSIAAGMARFSLLTPDGTPCAVLLPAPLVAGIGLGLTLATLVIVGVRGVTADDSGIASGQGSSCRS